jgi:hypothetical protein
MQVSVPALIADTAGLQFILWNSSQSLFAVTDSLPVFPFLLA